MTETLEHKVARLEDVIWKLEKQAHALAVWVGDIPLHLGPFDRLPHLDLHAPGPDTIVGQQPQIGVG